MRKKNSSLGDIRREREQRKASLCGRCGKVIYSRINKLCPRCRAEESEENDGN